MDPWGAVVAILVAVRRAEVALGTFGAAGFNIPIQQDGAHIQRITAYVAEAQPLYAGLNDQEKRRAVLAMLLFLQRELAPQAQHLAQLDEILLNQGWRLINNTLVQVDVIDPGELARVVQPARDELVRAAGRLPTDPTGAITAACGAIDTLTREAYRQHNLGDHGNDSFQQRVTRSLNAKGAWTTLQAELVALGWTEELGRRFVENARGSINQAAFVMQTLRANMGDAHGVRPTLDEMVFTSIKMAVVICVLLS